MNRTSPIMLTVLLLLIALNGAYQVSRNAVHERYDDVIEDFKRQLTLRQTPMTDKPAVDSIIIDTLHKLYPKTVFFRADSILPFVENVLPGILKKYHAKFR